MLVKRSELNKKYGLTKNHWERRHDEVLEFLSEFMSIKETVTSTGRYIYEIDVEALPNIPKMPAKNSQQVKRKDYEEYVCANLGVEYKPNSKVKVARDAIKDFAYLRYGHENEKTIARRYTGPIMEEKGEHSKHQVWVNSLTYELLNDEELNYLRKCFNEVKLSDEEMKDAFIKYADGEDIKEEVFNYKKAIEMFKQEYHIIPIHVYEWRAKVVED